MGRGPTGVASPGSRTEAQTLSPSPDPLNQNPQYYRFPRGFLFTFRSEKSSYLSLAHAVFQSHWQAFSLKQKRETQSTSRSRSFTEGVYMDLSWNPEGRSEAKLRASYPLLLRPPHPGFYLAHHRSPSPSLHHHIQELDSGPVWCFSPRHP